LPVSFEKKNIRKAVVEEHNNLYYRINKKLNSDDYFARPYHSWERGNNENLNGLIRQYFKKSSDFTTLTDAQVKAIEDKLNRRPKKDVIMKILSLS
jgi:IS30 family transposase